MQRTKIEYLTHTWNPIVMRCTPCSPGCDHCLHLRTCDRMRHNPRLSQEQRDAYAGKHRYLDGDALGEPYRLKKRAIIGVQFMGDLFHEDNQTGWVEEVLYAMNLADSHTYLLLTKRPANIRSFGQDLQKMPHVWIGVTICDQRDADASIPMLLDVPAAVRWLSVEPLLRPTRVGLSGISWVVCGAEGGPGRRPIDLDWVRSLRDQCVAAGVPFFYKQGPNANGKIISMPPLDGVVWAQMPADRRG